MSPELRGTATYPIPGACPPPCWGTIPIATSLRGYKPCPPCSFLDWLQVTRHLTPGELESESESPGRIGTGAVGLSGDKGAGGGGGASKDSHPVCPLQSQ